MLRSTFDYLVKPFLYWLFIFALFRLVFLGYHFTKITESGWIQTGISFRKGFALDISTATYFLLLPFIALLLQQVFRNIRFLNLFHKIYYPVLILCTSFVFSIDLELYNEWGTKLNYKALSFLTTPQSIIAITSTSGLVKVAALFLLQSIIAILMYFKFVYKKYESRQIQWIPVAGFIILIPGLLLLGVRGGWQEIPINQSSAYYSNNQTLNYAAVNSSWNIIHSILENKVHLDTNPYIYQDFTTAEHTLNELMQIKSDPSAHTNILTTNRPNIVMILLESWSAGTFQSLGAERNYCPNLELLIDSGILFTNYYSSGFRTDQGLVAVMSGFPSQPVTTIASQPDKFRNLSSLPKLLKDRGYQTTFVFGGEPEFGNFKTFLIYNSFDRIIDYHDFPHSLFYSKLGVHDEYVIHKLHETANETKEPFLSVMLTQSTHEPFIIPGNPFYGEDSKVNKYLSAIHYTDAELGDFFESIKSEPWYPNTLFVISSDHGHKFPTDAFISDKDRFHIPLILYGEVIKKKDRGSKIESIISQTDFAYSTLKQLQIEPENFNWSKDIFNPTIPDYAFYTFVDGFGFVTPEGNFSYENRFKKFNHKVFNAPESEDSLVQIGQAYMQMVFQTYLDY